MDKDAGTGKAKRPPLPKLPLENLNIGPFGYSGFAQPLDSLDSSSHTLLTDYGPASMQAVGPDEHPKADEPEGEVPLDHESSSVTALRARLMQSFETEGKLRIQAEMAAADLECALEDKTKSLRHAKAAEKRAVDAERTLKDYLATPAEAKVKRLEKQVAKFMEDNSRLRLQVQALQEENQRHVSLYQRSERTLKALQLKERAQARALLKVQESGRQARAAPEVPEAWNTQVHTPSNMGGVEDLRAQVMELKGALNQATNTNSSLLRSSTDLKEVQTVGEDAPPTVQAISQIDHRLANIENSMGRRAAAGMGERASLGWQTHVQPARQQIQGWNNLAPYPQMNPAPASSPYQYRGEVPTSRQRPRPQSAMGAGTRAPPSPHAGGNGEQLNPPPRFQRAHTHFPDGGVRTECVNVPRAADRIRPRHSSAGPHRRGEGLGAPGRALAPTYSALPKDGFAVPPSKMSEAALANARVEYAAECRRIKDMLSVKLEEIPM